MGKFSEYLDDIKSQTDGLRSTVTQKSGVDCTNLSISGVAEVVKGMEAGGKEPVLQEKSVNPQTYSQQVKADAGYDGLSGVNVGAVTKDIDANITPTNIRAGVSILGVQGNLSSDKPDQSKTVTPTTSDQRVFADSGYELSEVLVKGVTKDIDSNIKAGNIKRGTTILGVSGEFDGGELQSKTVTPTTSEQDVTPDANYYGLSGVKVNAVNPADYYKQEEIVNVTPSTESQKITPTENKVFKEVNVGAVTSAIDSNILADNIKKDVTILGVTGTLEQGGAEDLNTELTAQDEAITRLTLAVDGLGTGGESKELVIDLPSTFSSATSIYYFQYNKDKILISSSTDNIGIWEYSISGNTITRLYNKGKTWQYFQIVGDKCLIAGVSDNYGTQTGVLLYDGNTITQIYSGGSYWQNFKVIGDKCLISSSQSSNSTGILLYDGNTITKIYDTGYNWQYFQIVGNKCLIGGSISSSTGVLLYDGDTITQLYGTSYGWQYFKVIGDKCLISSNRSSTGILLYDGTTITQLYESGYAWAYFKIVGDKCLIGGSISSSTGVLLYDGDTITQLYGTSYGWQYFKVIGDKCLISSRQSSNSTGILLYDGNTITQLYTSGTYWAYFKVIGDKCLISSSQSSNSTGILLYDGNTITKKYSGGYGWQYFKENEDGTIDITSSNSDYKHMTLTYNPADDTVKVTKVKVV